MTLTSDHLAWQQRVFKETHASSKFMDLERQSIRSGGAFSKSHLLFYNCNKHKNCFMLVTTKALALLPIINSLIDDLE